MDRADEQGGPSNAKANPRGCHHGAQRPPTTVSFKVTGEFLYIVFLFRTSAGIQKAQKHSCFYMLFFFLLKSSVCLEAISTFTCKTGHWLSVAKEILDERQAERVREESPW